MVALLAALVLALGGCAGESGTVSDGSAAGGGGPGGIGGLAQVVATAGTGADATDGSPDAPSTTASGASPSGSGSRSASTPAGVTRTVGAGESLQFVTPSKNIGCYLDPDGVRCDIADRIWKVEKPSDCELDYGQGVQVSDGMATFVCAGDTVLGGTTLLGYGETAKAGDFSCLSQKEGVTCRNNATGRGFTLAKEGHTFF